MAKSSRSKSKLQAKAMKRSLEFQKYEDERRKRLFEKSQAALVKQKEEASEDKDSKPAKVSTVEVDIDIDSVPLKKPEKRTTKKNFKKRSRRQKWNHRLGFEQFTPEKPW
ncbi:hypothetical protein LJB42_004767 [Komagataella kurtzmanii]|nr:hypothetical protein LJB42_004767 [Komagataella kurtzmanii]